VGAGWAPEAINVTVPNNERPWPVRHTSLAAFQKRVLHWSTHVHCCVVQPITTCVASAHTHVQGLSFFTELHTLA